MTTKYFAKSVNTDVTCDVGATSRDLDKTQGTPGTQNSSGTQSDGVFEEILVFDMDVSADGPSTGSHDVSIDVASASPAAEFDYRFRIQAIDDTGCVISANSSYSSVFTGTGIKTATLSLTWSGVDERLRLSIEGERLSGHGNKSLTMNINDPDSFVDAPWTVGGVAFTERGPARGVMRGVGRGI